MKLSGLGYLFFGYLFGAMFSEHIYMNLALTEWTSLWTYAWLLFWPIFLFVKIGAWVLVAVIGIFILYQCGYRVRYGRWDF